MRPATRRVARLCLIAATLWATACSERTEHEQPSVEIVEMAAPDPAVDVGTIPPDSVLTLALAVYDRGAFDTATVLLESAVARALEEEDTAVHAEALTWLGNASRNLGDYPAARRLGEAALQLKLRAGLDDQLWRSYNALGLLAWWESRLPDAAEFYDLALAAAEATGDTEAVAKVTNNRGLVHYDLGNFGAAREGFEKLRDAGRALNSPLEEGEGLANLGMLETALGDPRSAIRNLEEARAIFASIGDANREQIALGHLGSAYLVLGQAGRAHAAFDTALRVARDAGLKPEEAQNLELVAHVYALAGDARRALRYYQDARAINLELGDDFYAGIALRSEAIVHASLGALPTARTRALEALQLHGSLGVPVEELRDRLTLAEIAVRENDAAEVDRQLSAVDRLADELDAAPFRIETSLTRARIADAREDSERVIETLNRILGALDATGFATEWEVHALMARAFLRLDRLPESIEAGRRAVGAIERIRESFASGVLRTSFQAARTRTYADLVSALLRSGDTEGAFETADAARGRALAEHLAAEDRENPDPTTQELAEGQEILTRIQRLAAALAGEGGAPPPDSTARQLEALLTGARSEYEDHLVRIASLDAGRAGALGVLAPELADIQGALREGEILLDYLVTPERLLVFIITRNGLEVAESQIPEENLASRARIARDLLAQSDADEEDVAEILTELHRYLMGPADRAAREVGATEVIVVPQGAISYLPFAALRDPVTERYLIESHSIAYLPSAGALPLLRQRERASRLPPSRTTVHALAPDPTGLPATRMEVESIAGTLARTIVSLGVEASEEEARTALESGRAVHIASHAALTPENPLFSWIDLEAADRAGAAVAPHDGRLEIHEVLGLSISSPLVFLSGCETGVGRAWSNRFSQGEDYATLAQAFLYAGADRVIATLWRVEDQGAAELASEFYRQLVQGEASPVKALARAQRAMLDHDRYGSPYHWAGYRISG